MAHTIYDIAQLANVSKSTVSRVLNNQGNISKESRDRVLKAIKELNFQPSKLARGLSVGFDAILILSRSAKTTANNPFFSEIIHSISLKAEEENMDVILQTSKNNEDELEKCIAKIKEKMIKGIIMLSSPANEDQFKQLDHFNIPIVVIGNVENSYRNIYSVDTDNYQDSYNLTKYLIQQGHKKIGCLHPPLDYHVSVDRVHGYKDCLRDYHLPLHEEWIMESDYALESACRAASEFLRIKDRPTAVFATDDLKVLSVYKESALCGVSIPDDLSIIGYSNTSYTPFFSPALTSIEIPVNILGETAAQLLFSKIKKDSGIDPKTIIPTEMIINESVARLS